MTNEEAKEIFLNRGYIQVKGGRIYDGDKWRESVVVISKWLEQEPCEDCISRNDLREETIIVAENEYQKGWNDALESVYKHAPSIQPKAKWISVSERQPNNSGMYLVSGNNKVWICEFLILGEICGGWVNDALNPTVKAWMPLSKPYEGE